MGTPPDIKRALGIQGMATTVSGWMFRPKHVKAGDRNGPVETRIDKSRNDLGTQIDLLIDRADRCISLCEIKFSDSEFVISKSYAENLRKKRDIFRAQTGTRKTVFIVMITTYGVRENDHFQRLIDQQLTIDALFHP